MAQGTDSTYRPDTFGNWRVPSSAGVMGFSTVASAIGIFGMAVVGIATLVWGITWRPIVLFVSLTAVMLLFNMRDRHGRDGFTKVATRLAWWRTRARGEHLYRSGPLGRSRWGSCQLPGIAASTVLTEGIDSYERPFALVSSPSTGTHAVMLACEPEGDALVDHEQIDRWAAGYSAWLTTLADEPHLVGASVTIETAPDTGARLRREVSQNVRDDAPPVARQMMQAIGDTYPSAAAETSVTAALTFERRANRQGIDDMVRQLSPRIPGLAGGLTESGSGSVEPVSAQRLCEMVRCAYDPAAQAVLDDVYAAGETPELSWSDVGPTAQDAYWDRLRHDGAWSITWQMTLPPRGIVRATAMSGLLAPHPAILRKRVTIHYRPFDPERAAQLVEADVRAAKFNAAQRRRASARQEVSIRSAQQTSDEEATGAALMNFGITITATVASEDALPDAVAAINSRSASPLRLQIRPVYGSQDSAFAAGLPLGLIVPRHLSLPQQIREAR